MKCDETKPSCLKCIKFWGHCEGYQQLKRPPTKYRIHISNPLEALSRPLLPKGKISVLPVVTAPIDGTRFNSQREHDDFLNFRTQTAEQLPGLFNSALWSQVILQASHQEDFIKDAIIAIGALHSCGRRLVEDTDKKVSTGIEVTPHYRFALQLWGRALRKMQRKITGDDKGMRITLIACILVVCFEGLQGNFFQALTHAVNGHTILHAWLTKQKRYSRTKTITSHAHRVVEDDLIHAFERLDLQIMTYIDTREASIHSTLKNEGTETVRHMPSAFSTVDEARQYWELIQRRTSHAIAAMAAAAKENGNDQELMSIDMGLGKGSTTYYPESDLNISLSAPTAAEEAMEHGGCHDEIHKRFYDITTTLSSPQGLQLQAEYLQYSGEITRWFTAFAPFYETVKQGTRTWTAASILHIQAKMTEVMLLASFFGDEFSLDNFTPTFRSVCTLAQIVALDPFFSLPHLFTFDVLLVNPIRLIAKWCREPLVRRDSIALLRKLALREGMWDALVMASISEYVMEMEEECMDETGNIEKSMRARVTGVKIDTLKRTATVKCMRLGKRLDGTMDEKSTVIGW